jgi:inward rectifier potassium channel
MKFRPKIFRAPGADYQIQVVGDQRSPLRDYYHALLRMPWWFTLVSVAVIFLGANALFACGYLLTGGVAHAAHQPFVFADAFFFSVQTMGTVGYGALYPESRAANVLVVVESLVGVMLTALVTGLVFAKFSRSTARILFSREAVISPMDGVPTLMLRVGNQRGNKIVDAHIKLTMVRNERTAEGRTFYRMLDLKLTRDHILSLQRTWSLLHRIDADSPFFGHSPESIAELEVELQVMITGTDDITMQPVHADHRYFSRQILWGRRHADVLTETPDGNLILDLRPFHETEMTKPTTDFPYPRP